MSVIDARHILEKAGFNVAIGSPVSSNYAQGTVAYISPSGSAASGSVITIYPSTGFVPAPPPKKHSNPGGGGHGPGHGPGHGGPPGHGHGR